MRLPIKYELRNLSKIRPMNQKVLLLFLFGLIASIQLTLFWRVQEDFNNWFLQLSLYLSILWHLYQRRFSLTLVNSFPASILGFCLVIIPFLKPEFAVKEVSIFWLFLPVVSAIGLALLASGFQGIKQFWRELFLITVFPLITILVKLFGMLFKITVISAKLTAFILWYLGFESATQGSLVYVNNGIIDILAECTAIPLLILLLKVSFLLTFLFPYLLRNKYLPFLLAGIISVIFSIFRLIILALAVTDKSAFSYWHGVNGSNLLAFLSLFSFGIIILLVSPSHISSPSPTGTLPKNVRSRPVWIIFTGVSLVIILLNLWLNPSMGLEKKVVYQFPSQLSITGWQLINAESIPLPQQQPEQEAEAAQATTEGEVDKTKDILSGKIYSYQKDGQTLTINLYYLPITLGDVREYYQQFSRLPNLPSPKTILEKANANGYHLEFSEQQKRYLTACINSHGKSTATIPQFIAYFYRPYLNPSQWFNLLNGKQTLRDRRCLWGQLSLTGAKGSETELETVWQELLAYWQTNFPPLKP